MYSVHRFGVDLQEWMLLLLLVLFLCGLLSLYLTRSAGKNPEACLVSSMLLIFFLFCILSPDIKKNLITMHVSSSLFMSTASGEREDALPQTPECTNSAGLFKEAAGENQSQP